MPIHKKSRLNPTIQKWLREALSLALMLLVVFAFRSSFFEPFKIPSGSMIPTLFIGDYIIVNKFSYGWHLPLSDWFGYGVPLGEREPLRRGDVVVFLYPLDESINYIKRVVGLPGETVQMKEGVLYINGKEMPLRPVPAEAAAKVFEKLDDSRFSAAATEMYEEDLDGVKHAVFYAKGAMGHDFGPVTVPAESFFALGDNRDYSRDSRYWGPAPIRNVKGKAKFVWFSLSFGSPEHEQWEFNPWRIGTPVR